MSELYREVSGRLEQIVRWDVRAPDVVIEDACQLAWSRLVRHAGRVKQESVLTWLAKTAIHEAVRLLVREDRELSLDAVAAELEDEVDALGTEQGPEELYPNRERLAALRLLPERQQRMLWLHALGLSYVEVGRYTGDSRRTVERQLLRAKRAIRDIAPA